MECYERTKINMTIKTFRGLMTDDTQDTIVLHTNDGSTGYRIVKFQVMGPNNNTNFEHVVKIYKISQTTVSTDIDFSDNTLLAAAIVGSDDSRSILTTPVIIFDNEIFNQDIYVTNKGHDNTTNINYYIELEQIKLDLNENTVATLKDLRNSTAPMSS